MIIDRDKACRAFKKWLKDNPSLTKKFSFYNITDVDKWAAKYIESWSDEVKVGYLLFTWINRYPSDFRSQTKPPLVEELFANNICLKEPKKETFSIPNGEEPEKWMIETPMYVVEDTCKYFGVKFHFIFKATEQPTKFFIRMNGMNEFSGRYGTWSPSPSPRELNSLLVSRLNRWGKTIFAVLRENENIQNLKAEGIIKAENIQEAIKFQEKQFGLLGDISKLERLLKELRDDIDESAISKRKIKEVREVLSDLSGRLKWLKDDPIIGLSKDDTKKFFLRALGGEPGRLSSRLEKILEEENGKSD